MWLLPLLAFLISLVFAILLGRQYVRRRRPHQAFWAVALLMYAGASFSLFLGAISGWSEGVYKAYWLMGAVLNVPYLAQGEIQLLVRNRYVTSGLLLLLLFGTAFAAARVSRAGILGTALAEDLPSGREVFGEANPAYRLARLYSLPAYLILVAGTLWSAAGMRRRPALRDRFWGTLGIAAGATLVAAGAAFAASGSLPGLSLTLTGGIAVMFWGFLRASRRPPQRDVPLPGT
jgi:hypothetical protein